MKKPDFSTIDPKQNIIIKGAHLHNLKNIDVVIPRNKMVVITGLSGSGKSSLAFDTLYAEGQRRYVESLSSYARQFLGRINKPKVEYIKGIAPAVAIEQKVNTTNARSTVGTSTEIYDYLKLLYARIGRTFSPISGNEVKKHTVTDVTDTVKTFDETSKWLLLAPIYELKERSIIDQLKIALQQGFARLFYKNETHRIDEFIEQFSPKTIKAANVQLIIDRLVVRHEEDFYNRLSDAVDTAFFEGKGVLYLYELGTGNQLEFNNKFELDGITFLEPNVHLFSFNNPYGACPKCDGFGTTIGIDEDLVVPNTALSVYENAIYPWRGESMSWYRDQLVNNSHKFDFPIHKPYYELSDDQKKLIWEGNSYFTGLNDFFKDLEANNYKIQNRVELRDFFKTVQLNEFEEKVAKRLLLEINNRLQFLSDVGLDYLTINRKSSTLSGGESQRINLATSLGSSLVGSMYILDEPSIGLHSRDSEKLIDVLKNLRDLGNTVIIVEHDEDVMKAADEIIDIGPEAGVLGGELVAQGTFDEILKSDTLTANYLNGTLKIEVPEKRRPVKNVIEVKGARENNLKNIDVVFPLDCLTMVTGVSGSGKSTLVKKILYPAIEKHLTGTSEKAGQFNGITGSFSHIKHIEYVDQNPIGKS